jgi:surfeit locus 1 family protein
MSPRMKAFAVFILAMMATEIGLGIWQWRRLAEKTEMLAQIEAGTKAAPKPLAAAGTWDRVTLTGRFLNDKSAYVRTSRPEARRGGRDTGGFGVLVMTPFVTRSCAADGRCTLQTIYVNRGFVPTPPSGRIPAFDRPDDAVTLTGFLRPSEHPTLFQPGNSPERDTYFHRTVEQMAKRAGLFQAENSATSPYHRFIDRQGTPDETTPPYGVDVPTFLKAIPNNHFQYALTWWALALTNLVVAGFFLYSKRRRKRAED